MNTASNDCHFPSQKRFQSEMCRAGKLPGAAVEKRVSKTALQAVIGQDNAFFSQMPVLQRIDAHYNAISWNALSEINFGWGTGLITPYILP